jgi:hypothetical protein
MKTIKTLEATLAERNGHYGKYTEVSKISQSLKKIIRESPSYKFMPPIMKESLDMVSNKMARLLAGGNFYLHDTWLDLQGYCKLVSDELERLDRIERDFDEQR